MRIGIGTAQFGMDYGISNTEGKTPVEEVKKILEVAASNGIRVIDTAAAYGTSEEVLGSTWPNGYGFDVVTKTPKFSKSVIDEADAQQLEDTFQHSLRNMRLPSVYGLLIHHADDLLVDAGQLLMGKMLGLKKQGLVKKIGVSVYTAEQIERVLDKFPINLIQLTINVLDQRLLRSGHLTKLKKHGVEIHARSVFLQGLLLMDPTNLSSYFDSVKPILASYHESLKRQGLTPLQAALGFVAGLDEVDSIICGVNNHKQLEETCNNLTSLDASRFIQFAISDEAILNPSRWVKL